MSSADPSPHPEGHFTPAPPADPRRSRWIPWAIVAFFGVVLAANGALLGFSIDTFNGLATDNAYDRGLAYNDTLEKLAAQEALGWQVTDRYAAIDPLQGRLTVAVREADGTALTGATVTATIDRPLQEGFTRTVTLDPVGIGVYATDLDFPMPGNWAIGIAIDHPQGRYVLEKGIVVR
ncbi:MAG: FixH family protein [Alphaproteobacteria bacterium]